MTKDLFALHEHLKVKLLHVWQCRSFAHEYNSVEGTSVQVHMHACVAVGLLYEGMKACVGLPHANALAPSAPSAQ